MTHSWFGVVCSQTPQILAHFGPFYRHFSNILWSQRLAKGSLTERNQASHFPSFSRFARILGLLWVKDGFFFGPKLRRCGTAPLNLVCTPQAANGELGAETLDWEGHVSMANQKMLEYSRS